MKSKAATKPVIASTDKTDRLIERFFEQQNQMISYIAKLDKTLESINDNNVLHTQAFTATISQSNQVLDNVASATNATSKIFRNILYLLVLAIIVLAGVEKLPKVMGLF